MRGATGTLRASVSQKYGSREEAKLEAGRRGVRQIAIALERARAVRDRANAEFARLERDFCEATERLADATVAMREKPPKED